MSARRDRSRGSLRRSRAAGFTILELLLVTMLLALFFGVGVGMLSSLDLGKRAAAGNVVNVIRAARNSAVARGAHARVRLDKQKGILVAEGLAVLGTWHFEDERARGALGLAGVNQGGRYLDDGFIGRAISFARAPGGSAYTVATQEDAGFDLRDGFAIDLAVRLDVQGAGRALNAGNVIGIDVSSARAVKAWFFPTALDKQGAPTIGGKTTVESGVGAVVDGRWTRVRVEYDRELLKLFLDGVEVARAEETGAVWRPDGPLAICDPKVGFPGAIDNVVVAGVGSRAELVLPESVKLDADAPDAIRFAPGGALDREHHEQPVAFHLALADGTRPLVRIGLYGTVE